MGDDRLLECGDVLISFLTEKEVDGKMMMNYGRKQFVNDVTEFAGNKKIEGNAIKFFKALEAFDLSEITGSNTETVCYLHSVSK